MRNRSKSANLFQAFQPFSRFSLVQFLSQFGTLKFRDSELRFLVVVYIRLIFDECAAAIARDSHNMNDLEVYLRELSLSLSHDLVELRLCSPEYAL